MFTRVVPLFFLVLGLTVLSARAEEKKADPNTHDGKVVKAAGNKLTMVSKDGKTEHTHTLAPDAKITCDGKVCKLEDLKPGTTVRVTTKPDDKTTAIKVEGRTKD